VVHREKVAAAHREHAAGVAREKKLLRELGVPDLTPEEVTERARATQRATRWPSGIRNSPPPFRSSPFAFRLSRASGSHDPVIVEIKIALPSLPVPR
jgi:hypothetical protein